MTDLAQRLRDYLKARVTYPTDQGEPEYVRLLRGAAAAIDSLTAERDALAAEKAKSLATRSDLFTTANKRIQDAEARLAAAERVVEAAREHVEIYDPAHVRSTPILEALAAYDSQNLNSEKVGE